MKIELMYTNGKPYTIKNVSTYTTCYEKTNLLLHVRFNGGETKTYKNLMSLKCFYSNSINIEFNIYIKNLSVKTNITTNKLELMKEKDLNSENPLNLLPVHKARDLKRKVYTLAKGLGYKNEVDLKETLAKIGVKCRYYKCHNDIYYILSSVSKPLWKTLGFKSMKEFDSVLHEITYKKFPYGGDSYSLNFDIGD